MCASATTGAFGGCTSPSDMVCVLFGVCDESKGERGMVRLMDNIQVEAMTDGFT